MIVQNLRQEKYDGVILYKRYESLYPELVSYLQTYYFKRCERWAMCYRNFPHAGTDTNMFVESYHNRLKTFYLNRKRNKRVDDLFNLLLNIEEDDYWRHKRDAVFSGPGSQDRPVATRHDRGMLIPNNDIVEECDRWKVTSQNSHGDYFVTR